MISDALLGLTDKSPSCRGGKSKKKLYSSKSAFFLLEWNFNQMQAKITVEKFTQVKVKCI